MVYLCPTHQRALRQSPKLAMTLWRNAMASGVSARHRKDWGIARNFFGSAYEAALLTLSHPQHKPGSAFTPEHLVDAGRLLADTLEQLGRYDEALLCLITLQNTLLHPPQSGSRISSQLTMKIIGRCVDELMAATGMEQRLEHYRPAKEGMQWKQVAGTRPVKLH